MTEETNKYFKHIIIDKTDFSSLNKYFYDPIADKTDFSPLNKYSTWTWKTLTYDESWNILFRGEKNIFSQIIFWVIMIGVIAWVIRFISVWKYDVETVMQTSFWLIASIFFAFLVTHMKTMDKVFNFQNGYFYSVEWDKDHLNLDNAKGKKTPLKDIYAIQIIEKKVYRDGAVRSIVGFIWYELNLVLKDWSRTQITDYNSMYNIKETPYILAKKLWIKVWDVTKLDKGS